MFSLICPSYGVEECPSSRPRFMRRKPCAETSNVFEGAVPDRSPEKIVAS